MQRAQWHTSITLSASEITSVDAVNLAIDDFRSGEKELFEKAQAPLEQQPTGIHVSEPLAAKSAI